jgi:acetyl esterase/lipase
LKPRRSAIWNFIMTKCNLFLTAAMLATTLSVRAQTPSTAPPPQTSASAPEDSSTSIQHDVLYGQAGGHPLLLDIYQPPAHSDLRPAIILIHGGGWSTFDKSTMSGMAGFIARSGFVAFSVDYRLLKGNENLWPAQLDDVQRAVRWIRASAPFYKVDPRHLGAFGHSSGAQLASLLAMEDTRDNSDPALAKYSSQVQAVVDVNGPTDFTVHHDAEVDSFLASFFGGDYAHHPEIWQNASPTFHVSNKVSPFLIFHGTHDSFVPMSQSEELADKLKQAGVPVTLVKVEDGHVFETSEARKRMAIESRDFFFKYLRPDKH